MTLTRNQKILSAVLATTGAASLWAFNSQPDPPSFGAISVLPSETMRLNVVCHTSPSEHSCNIALGFNGPDGRPLKQAIVTVQPGAIGYLELSPADLRGIIDPNILRRPGGGVPIVPTVVTEAFPPDPYAPSGSRTTIPTVEVYDTVTGKTDLFVNVAAPRLSLFSTGL